MREFKRQERRVDVGLYCECESAVSKFFIDVSKMMSVPSSRESSVGRLWLTPLACFALCHTVSTFVSRLILLHVFLTGLGAYL